LIRNRATPAASALRRGGLLAASLFVVWHAFALVVAPFPPSYLSGRVHAAIFPYLSVLYLDTDWNFFAPTPAPGRFVRYVVETRDGGGHPFRLTEDRRPGPSAMGLRKVYDGIHPDRPEHYESVGRFLCRRHAGLEPVTVTFFVHRQIPITPEAYVAGRRPLDGDLVEVETLPPVSCPRQLLSRAG
jgi:hypothetical protein